MKSFIYETIFHLLEVAWQSGLPNLMRYRIFVDTGVEILWHEADQQLSSGYHIDCKSWMSLAKISKRQFSKRWNSYLDIFIPIWMILFNDAPHQKMLGRGYSFKFDNEHGLIYAEQNKLNSPS